MSSLRMLSLAPESEDFLLLFFSSEGVTAAHFTFKILIHVS